MLQPRNESWRRPSRSLAGAFLLLALECSASPGPTDTATEPPAFPNQRSGFASGENTLGYVANRFSDTVSVLDLEEFRTLASVPIGRDPVDIDGPVHVVLDEPRARAYVVLSYPFSVSSPHVAASGATRRNGYVRELSLLDLAPLSDLRVDPRAGDLAFSRDQSLLAVSHFDQDLALNVEVEARRANVAWVSPPWSREPGAESAHEIPVCATPAGLVFGEDASRLFVACTGEDSLVVVGTDSGKVLARVPAGNDPVNKPFSLTSNASRTRLLLSNQVTRKVVQFTADDELSLLFATEAFEGIPYAATFTSEREFVVPLQSPSGAARVDALSGEILAQIAYSDADCANPSQASVLAGGRLFLVCEGSHYEPGWVAELEPDTLQVQRTALVGIYPDRLAMLGPKQ